MGISNKDENLFSKIDDEDNSGFGAKFSINKMFNKSKIKPGFKRKIFFRKLPRILITKDTYKMGIGLMKRTSEKGIIRLVKVAAGVEQ